MLGGVGGENQATVEGHVEPLVGVGGPRVCSLDAGEEVAVAPADRRPPPERAIDVHPGASLMGDAARLGVVIEGSGVDLAGLQAHNRWAIPGSEFTAKPAEVEAPLWVGPGVDDRVGAQAEQPYRAVDRGVLVPRGDDPDRSRPGQAAAFDVPAAFGEQLVTGGGQRSGVAHLGAGDQSERGMSGQAEQVFEPHSANLLDHRLGGRARIQRGVLIPCRGQPVRRQRSRHRTADHPPEEPAAGAAQQPRLSITDQLSDHLRRIHWPIGQGPPQNLPQLPDPGGNRDLPLVQRLVEIRCMIGCLPQRRAAGTGRPCAAWRTACLSATDCSRIGGPHQVTSVFFVCIEDGGLTHRGGGGDASRPCAVRCSLRAGLGWPSL